VRTKEYLYIKNNFPNQQNLCVEAYEFEAGEDLWKAQAEGRTTPVQQLLFANPSPAEELYRVADDPDQFQNLADNEEFAEAKQKLRRVLVEWTDQTGDTVPSDPTPDRDLPPRIENGRLVPSESQKNRAFRHREMPGANAGAEQINHPGPVRLK
jgi:arylsulfatase